MGDIVQLSYIRKLFRSDPEYLETQQYLMINLGWRRRATCMSFVKSGYSTQKAQLVKLQQY